MYNFSKTSHDANWREFKQPLFRKGKRSLLSLITRKTQQKNQQERVAIDPILEKIPVSQSKHEKIGRTSKLSIDPTNGNLTNGDLIALIFELQNKLSHMESRIYFLEKHLLECPNYVGDHGQDDYTISVSPSLSIQSLTSPSAAFTMPNQSFRDPQSLSLPSTRQNSENGSMCSELGSLISTRSRSSTFTDKVRNILNVV